MRIHPSWHWLLKGHHSSPFVQGQWRQPQKADPPAPRQLLCSPQSNREMLLEPWVDLFLLYAIVILARNKRSFNSFLYRAFPVDWTSPLRRGIGKRLPLLRLFPEKEEKQMRNSIENS